MKTEKSQYLSTVASPSASAQMEGLEELQDRPAGIQYPLALVDAAFALGRRKVCLRGPLRCAARHSIRGAALRRWLKMSDTIFVLSVRSSLLFFQYVLGASVWIPVDCHIATEGSRRLVLERSEMVVMSVSPSSCTFRTSLARTSALIYSTVL